MSDSRWIEDVEELLARSLGGSRPTPDFASWRRRYSETPPAIRARTNDWSAGGPVRGRTAGAASWLADHRVWSAAAAMLVAVCAISAYLLLKDRGGGPVAKPDVVNNSAAAGRMPVVFDTRGLVLALPEGAREQIELTAGSAVPAGRTLWTCPWGSSSVRYADGTSVTLDRSTTAVFSPADSERVTLKHGTLFVTRRPSTAARERILVDAPAASVVIDQGEVTLVANGDQTIVEVAVGKAQVRGAGDGKAVTVSAGEYALVRPGKGPSAISGRLEWKVETRND